MLQLVDLGLDLGSHPGIGMSNRDGHDAAKKIQILLAFDVPHVLHGGVIGHQRVFVVNGDGREHVLLVLLEDIFFCHGRNLEKYFTGQTALCVWCFTFPATLSRSSIKFKSAPSLLRFSYFRQSSEFAKHKRVHV